MPLSKAIQSALLAVARIKGDSDVSTADLQKVLAAALRSLYDAYETIVDACCNA